MATQLFMKGADGGVAEAWVEAERVAAMVSNGWFFSMEDLKNAEVPESKAPSKEEADTNNTGKLSNKEVRQAAKKAGIETWETDRIKTLKGILGYDI